MSAKTPIFTGSAGGLVPIPGALMTKNAFGIDVLPRPFHAPRSRVKSLVPARGTSDIFYPNLRATGNYTILENEGLTCVLTVEYKGILNNAIPDVLISSGLSTGSTSATSGSDGPAEDQRTWEIVYYSPTRTYRYVTNGRPSGPKYRDYKGGPVNSATIYTQSIKDGNGRPRGGTGTINLTYGAQLNGLVSNPVPGTPYYENEEVWAGVIILR